ncbi:amidohydrolase family protein [Mesorhizobium sp. INR15]|uniref:metal-dependent hydrolase family protein n=1 Tax=Mesorhizobium sp. INR15 TaxID=2654248 RepID=UPI0018967DE2|nr:amidohydrolase family protein [Mesorhizobium sp. INR15]QPC95502.1 amidohydrolase family protein [Mesorhizobium sp. INR15]
MLITDGHVLDIDARRFRKRDIRFGDGIFMAVADRLDAKPGERTICAEGLWLLPGLIDAHVHVIGVEDDLRQLHRQPPYLVAAKSARVLDRMLSRGFTSVRDAGGADASLVTAIETGLFRGPRLFPSGRGLAQPGGQGDFRSDGESDLGCPCCAGRRSITRLASGPAALRLAVGEEIAAGATQIKVMASGGIASPGGPEKRQYDVDELRAIVNAATEAGTYVMAHAYGAAAIRACVEAGIRSIEHGSGLDKATAVLMAERGAVLVPTLVVFDRLARSGGALGETAQRIFDESCASIRLAQAAGVQIAHGSDLEGSAHVDQSAEFRLKASVMTASEVIASATVVSARLLPGPARRGVLDDGAVADLIALDQNPLADIEALATPERHLRLVIKGGDVVLGRHLVGNEGAEA